MVCGENNRAYTPPKPFMVLRNKAKDRDRCYGSLLLLLLTTTTTSYYVRAGLGAEKLAPCKHRLVAKHRIKGRYRISQGKKRRVGKRPESIQEIDGMGGRAGNKHSEAGELETASSAAR